MPYTETDLPELETAPATIAIIVRGQPWQLPASLTEQEITARLNTEDWDYSMPTDDVGAALDACINAADQAIAELKALLN